MLVILGNIVDYQHIRETFSMVSYKAYYFVITASVLPAVLVLYLAQSQTSFIHNVPLTVAALFSAAYVWILAKWTVPFFFNPLRHLPSPPGDWFLLGHGPALLSRPPGALFLKYVKAVQNNGLIHLRGFLHIGSSLLATSPEVLAEVLNNKPYDYEKPPRARRFLARILGDGLIIVEGKEHKMQRKSVAPAFQGRNIKDLVPTFWMKAKELTDAIALQLRASASSTEPGVVEIKKFISCATLDIIGLACLGRDFNSLANPDSDLVKQYEVILAPDKGSLATYFAVNMLLPYWLVQLLPWKMNQLIMEATRALRNSCRNLVAEKKAAMEKQSTEQVDILSVLMKSGAFTDDGLIDQLLTFLAAGYIFCAETLHLNNPLTVHRHETTSSALAWSTYLLSLHPAIQDGLRTEVRNKIRPDQPVDSDIIESLPFLSAVCNEVLRLYPTVPVTVRKAIRPTTILDQSVPTGTEVLICPWAINRLPALWGPDAESFVPDRWMGEGQANLGGASSNYSFITFVHGPRSCIGQGFAKAELKCLLAAMLLRFEMEMARPDEEVVPAGAITIKPKNGMRLRLKDLRG